IAGGIGDDVADAFQPGQKRLGLRAIAILAWCRMDPKRQTDRIDGGVQLGRQAAARTTDGGTFSSPFAPRSEAHTSELRSLMRRSYAVFGLKRKHLQSAIT